MKMRFGIILLPLLLPFIYASAQLHGKDGSNKRDIQLSSNKKGPIGLRASLYALAHAHIEKQRVEKQASAPSVELVALKSAMPRKQLPQQESNRPLSRKLQRERAQETPRSQASRTESYQPSIKRQTKSFSLNKE